jgi:hypothetical protein
MCDAVPFQAVCLNLLVSLRLQLPQLHKPDVCAENDLISK